LEQALRTDSGRAHCDRQLALCALQQELAIAEQVLATRQRLWSWLFLPTQLPCRYVQVISTMSELNHLAGGNLWSPA